MAKTKSLKTYWSASTAKWAKKAGDSMLIAGTTVSAISLDTMPHYVTYMSLGLTLAGKLVTNFFTEDAS